MVIIQIEFLNGTYHASDPTNAAQPEWPPAPDRVFQAFVDAAAALGVSLDPLRALECAPEIVYGDAQAVVESTAYVPAAFTTSGTSTPHSRTNVTKADPLMVLISDPVYYVWDAPVELAQWLRPVVAEVTHLGRAKSPVIASVVEAVPRLLHRRIPSAIGEELLRVPMPGRLDTLEAAYRAHVRAPVALMTGFTNPDSRIARSPWGELLALRTIDEVLLRETAQFAVAARAAVLALAGDTAPQTLHGHAAIPHVAWSALPDIGHSHAEGRVLGLGLWLPADINESDRTACVLPLMRLDHVMLNGRRIRMRRVPESGLPRGLTQATWTRSTRTWATVTPLVLDRNPKSNGTIEQAVADSVELAGYPRPVAVEVGQHSAHRGVPMSRSFKPRRSGRWTHALVAFDTPIRGPLIVGRERYFGLGLMRGINHETLAAVRSAA